MAAEPGGPVASGEPQATQDAAALLVVVEEEEEEEELELEAAEVTSRTARSDTKHPQARITKNLKKAKENEIGRG